MRITSTSNPTIKDITKLHQKKYRKERGLFLVEGYHLYEEAQKAGVIEHVFTTDAAIVGTDVTYVSDIVLQKLANAKQPQGIVTVCKIIPSTLVGDKVLLLDHIQDPGNLGTLLRSALAFGFDTIVLDNTVDVYNDKVLRSTQGAIFQLNLLETDIETFIQEHPGHTYIGTTMDGIELDDVIPTKQIGILLGNEGAGLSPHLQTKTLYNITIPMHQTESLNVGVAGSIIMYHYRTK
jgi:TrmH family RNA methyltransferase